MGIDGVNTKGNVYRPVRSKARAKLNVDDVMPTEEVPNSTDEEAREDRPRQREVKRRPGAPEGTIDERI